MKIVNFNIDKFNEIEIVPLADLHIGSPECDEELIKEVCDYISKTPNCYTILNGDIVDNATRSSIGSVFEETMSPKEQVNRATYYLKPIAEKGKIINITVGNHELRSEKDTGLSPSDLLLANLMKYDDSLNERYCVDGAYTFLTIPNRKKSKLSTVTFTIFNLHGTGGGTRIGAKVQKLDDMQMVAPAQIYIRSHTHQPETHRGLMIEVNNNNHSIKEVPCVFVSTNAYLKYGGYGARAGMKPLSRAIPVIKIKANRKTYKGREQTIKSVECTLKDTLE